MLKEAIEKIQSLVEEKNKIEEIELKGQTYTELHLSRIDEYIPKRQTIELYSLRSLII